MAVKKTNYNEILESEKSNLIVKKERKDNSRTTISLYLEKWRKEILTKHFKDTKGIGISTGIKQIVVEYMNNLGLK